MTDTDKIKEEVAQDATVGLAKEIDLLLVGKDLQMAATALGMVAGNIWSQFPAHIRDKALPAWIRVVMTDAETSAAKRGNSTTMEPVKPKLILPN